MEFQTNSNHKKIDLRNIDVSKKKRLPIQIGAVVLSLALLSGCGKTSTDSFENESSFNNETTVSDSVDVTADNSLPDGFTIEGEKDSFTIVEHQPNEEITISSYLYGVEFDDGRVVSGRTYTYDDLAHISSCYIIVQDDGDYDYLNYMTGLKNLSITDLSSGDRFKNIDGSRFPSGISIDITTPYHIGIFDEEHFGFLKDISSIDTLTLGSENTSLNMDSSYIQSLRNVHNLKLGLDLNSNFQYSDLTYLDSLEFLSKPYDTAMYFSNEMIEELEGAGVKVQADNMARLREINQKIREIALGLNILEDADDQTKLNGVLTYVLNALTYDPEVKAIIAETGSGDDNKSKEFYRDGHLTAAFEDPTQICGNYAALTYVLCREVGLDVYNLTSYNHGWNAVKVGDYYYYVDSTWLDGVTINHSIAHREDTENGYSIVYEFISQPAEEIFTEGNQEIINQLPWYMEDPTDFGDVENDKESHDPISVPVGLELVPIPREESSVELENMIEDTSLDDSNIEEDIEDISDKKVKITIDGKVFIIGGAALVGILSALGVGVLIHKKKEKKRLERLRRQNYYNDFSSFGSYDDPFGSDSFGSRRY